MKALYKSLLSAVILLSVTSCSQDETERFDTSRSALNIGFESSVYGRMVSTANFNYSETASERGLKFYVRVSGMPTSVDRPFTLEAVDGDIAKAHGSFRFDDYAVTAGQVTGEYYIYFDPSKLSDPSAFADEDGEIVFKLVPNDDFAEGALDQNELRVTLKNSLGMPENWYGRYASDQTAIYYYFKDYSLEKHQFLIENGLPVSFLIKTAQTANIDMDENGNLCLSGTYMNYLKDKCVLALREYNNTHDTPLCDGFGNPITF